MRTKLLRGCANTLATMAASGGSQELYLAIADLPDGAVHIDLLVGAASINGMPLPPNPAVARLEQWLSRRSATHDVGASLIEAQVDLSVDSRSTPTARERLLFFAVASRCVLRTNVGVGESATIHRRLWVNRPSFYTVAV